MTATHNSHRSHVAFKLESSIGGVPADEAAWAAAEGTTAWRHFVETADPAFIRGEMAVANADMQTRVGEAQPPHKGLPTADGGSLMLRLTGSGESFVTGAAVAGSRVGELLGHALGGVSLGNHATIAVVTSQLIFEVDDADDLEVGQIIGFQDTTTPGAFANRVFPALITAIDGVEITIAWQMPFTVAVGDHVIGAETAYYDQAALTNAEDANASTYSILIQKGPRAWVAGGSHLALESITFERGQQPKLNFPVLAACGYPPGTTGGLASVPTWAGTIQGSADVRAVGRDTKCRFAAANSTTYSEVSLFSMALAVGCPVLPQDTVTEESSGSPGRLFYRTEPAETTATVVLALADAQQTQWTAGSRVTLTYFQVSTVGRCYCVHLRDAFLNEAPNPQTADVNKYEVIVRASDDTTAETELAASKILVAVY